MRNVYFGVFCSIFGGNIFVTDAFTQDYFWRDYVPNEIPDDAFQGALGRYIGQVIHQDNLLVATIYIYTNTAVTEIYGQKNYNRNIKIFCTSQPNRFYWEHVKLNGTNDQQMKDAVKGGYEQHIDSDIYIGKTMRDGEWKIGKVVDIAYPGRGLWVWDQAGNAARTYEFFILKYNSSNVEINIPLS